jgi:hypothetical protein
MTSRKFRLLDAVILVAAVAVGLVWVRAEQVREGFLRQFGEGRFPTPYIERTFGWLGNACFEADGYILPCAATLTLAITALTLQHHRRALGRVTRQPGALACIAASLAILLEMLQGCLETFRSIVVLGWKLEDHRPHIHFVWSTSLIPTVTPTGSGLAVAVVWGILLLGGRRSRKSDWLELIGRVVGLFWIARGLVEVIQPWDFLPHPLYIPGLSTPYAARLSSDVGWVVTQSV